MTKALLIHTNKYWGWEHRADNINREKGFFDLAWLISKSKYDQMDVESQSYHYPLYFLFREGESDDMHFTPSEIEKIGKEYDIFLEKEVSGFPIEDTLTILKNEPITYQSMFKEAPSKAKTYQDIVDWFADDKNKAKEGKWEVNEMVVNIEKIITMLEDEENRVKKIQEAALDASAKSAESFNAHGDSPPPASDKKPTTPKKYLFVMTDKYWGRDMKTINREKDFFDLAWVMSKSQYDKMDVESQSKHYRLVFLFDEVNLNSQMRFTPTEIAKIKKEYGNMQVDDWRFPIEDILTKISGSKNEQSFKEAPPDAKSQQEILDWFADPKNKSKIKSGEWEVTRTITDRNKITAVLDELEGKAAETVMIAGNKNDKNYFVAHIKGMQDKEGFTPEAIIGGNEELDNPLYAKIVEDGAKEGLYDNHAESVGFAAENLEYKFAIISKYDDSIIPSTDIPEGLETIGKVHVTLVGGKALKPFKAALKENAKESIAGLPEAPTPVFGDMGIAERTMGDGEVRKTAFLEVENQEDFHDYVDTMCDALGIENPESDRWFHVSIANNHGGNPFKSVGDITEADLRGSHSAEYFAFNAEGETMPLYVYDAECGCMMQADTLKFKDWANQEQQSHGDPSFGEWADEEGDEHGDTSFDDWAEHETASHEAHFEAASEKTDSWHKTTFDEVTTDMPWGKEGLYRYVAWADSPAGEIKVKILSITKSRAKSHLHPLKASSITVENDDGGRWVDNLADFLKDYKPEGGEYGEGLNSNLYPISYTDTKNYNFEAESFGTVYTGDGDDEGCSECERTIENGEQIFVDDEGSMMICSDCKRAEGFGAESPFSESVEWLNRKTGEIATSIPLLQRKGWVKLDAESDEEDDDDEGPIITWDDHLGWQYDAENKDPEKEIITCEWCYKTIGTAEQMDGNHVEWNNINGETICGKCDAAREKEGDQDLDPHYTPFYAEGMSSVACDVGLGAAIGVAGAWLTGWWKL